MRLAVAAMAASPSGPSALKRLGRAGGRVADERGLAGAGDAVDQADLGRGAGDDTADDR